MYPSLDVETGKQAQPHRPPGHPNGFSDQVLLCYEQENQQNDKAERDGRGKGSIDEPVKKRTNKACDCIKLFFKILLALSVIVVILFWSIQAYGAFFHPDTDNSSSVNLESPPPCDGDPTYTYTEMRRVSAADIQLKFNYVSWVSKSGYEKSRAKIHYGAAIINVNGQKVIGKDSRRVWKELTDKKESEILVQTCFGALAKLQACERKYGDKYDEKYYPFRFEDMIRRCEAEKWNEYAESSVFEDQWRDVQGFVHKLPRFF
ncbi:hypothetical protein PRIPAC_87764 [Pristionchus pacificus]|uniref:Uncharacterized protein n=1 Tax=Pristionchus pacificus TaxID=54126 RepID=A0A2A6B8Z3_PRIPA|nr:hypothetical protein PRIPAC_87764 [Pristionchus pacificus]|eukprot:PDM62334.1 hypothetical protein PRIPAC_51776 [Pristionchus pacificus]